jgi:hypothetical protein
MMFVKWTHIVWPWQSAISSLCLSAWFNSRIAGQICMRC